MHTETKLIKKYTYGIFAAWTLFIIALLYYTQTEHREEMLDMARVEAMAAFDKDVVYRRWNAMHGGLYALVTEKTSPNPLLSHIPERDITTPSGKKLTLINPAYMTRQVHEITVMDSGILGHITSLNPLRNENSPDPWEKEALLAFERGAGEVSSLETIHDTEYLRFMRPLITEAPCLQCHAAQGYKIGDTRGGISVSVPIKPFWTAYNRALKKNLVIYGLIWLSGLIFIGTGSRQLLRKTRKISEEKSRYQMLFNNAVEAIVLVDPETGIILDANEKAGELFGMAAEKIRGMYQKEFHEQADGIGYPAFFRKITESGTYLDQTGFITNSRGQKIPVEISISIAKVGDSTVAQSIYRDTTELHNALEEIKTLHGILPICSYCKKIRDDKGSWEQIETYISEHSDALFSHGICAECAKKMYPEIFNKEQESVRHQT